MQQTTLNFIMNIHQRLLDSTLFLNVIQSDRLYRSESISQFARDNNEEGQVQSKYCHFMATVVGTLS